MSEAEAIALSAARFVADGIVVLDGVAPRELNQACVQALVGGALPSWSGPGPSPPSEVLAELLALPAVAALADVLLPAGASWGGHKAHVAAAGEGARCWHADGAIDRRLGFDLLLYWFPCELAPGSGATSFLPGSHYRRVHQEDIACYQRFLGERQPQGGAGTVVVSHHALWHTANRNRGAQPRPMVKLRLDSPGIGASPALAEWARHPEVEERLSVDHGWYGNEYRLEVRNRVLRWRALTGLDDFDVDGLVGRMEAE